MESLIVKILSSKVFWIIVAVIVIALIINAHWDSISRSLFGRKITSGYTTDATGAVIQVTELDKQRLDKFAQDLHSGIYGFWPLDQSLLDATQVLSDQELDYLAKTYKNVFGTKLYTDLDDEILPGTTVDDKILSRLAALKLS